MLVAAEINIAGFVGVDGEVGLEGEIGGCIRDALDAGGEGSAVDGAPQSKRLESEQEPIVVDGIDGDRAAVAAVKGDPIIGIEVVAAIDPGVLRSALSLRQSSERVP